jgi:hypothetical protein
MVYPSFFSGKHFPNSLMMRLMMYRVRIVPPIPQTIIVTPKVKLSMALPSLKKPWCHIVLGFLDSSKQLPHSTNVAKRTSFFRDFSLLRASAYTFTFLVDKLYKDWVKSSLYLS